MVNTLSAGVGLALALACTAWMSGAAHVLAVPGQLVAGALKTGLSVLWYHCKLWFAAFLLGFSVLYCFFLERILINLANQQLYTLDANKQATGTLAAPLQADDVEIHLLRCRLSVRRVKLNPRLLEDAVLDPILNWTPFRARAIEIAELSLKWSLLQSPRLILQLDGLHVSMYGQWVDDACLVRSFRIARQSLWSWVDDISTHDRDRVVQRASQGVEEPRKTTEVRSWCNCTGQLLTVAGPERWFHRRGSMYDLCGAVYDELPDGVNGKDSFVRVLSVADLGTEADCCIYRVASSHEHPDLHEQQLQTQTHPATPVAAPPSKIMKFLAENIMFSMTDARLSYAQMSMVGCPTGMQNEYIPVDRRNEAERSDPECELHGFLFRVGRLWLGPNRRSSLTDEQEEWSQQWSQLQPPTTVQLNPSKERITFDPWELKQVTRSKPVSAENLGIVGQQEGGLENFTIHLLGGAEKLSKPNQVPSMRDLKPHIERRTGPHYDGETQDRNLRAPMVLLNSNFTFFRTGASIVPLGEIHRIECPTSAFRLKVSTQDAAIMTPLAARVMQYKAHADATLSTGSISLRPSLSGFAVMKQKLSSAERWHWSFKCIIRTLRDERSDLSWETVQHQCSVRKAHLKIWKQYIYKDIQLAVWGNDRTGRSQVERELAQLRCQAMELENQFEYDQCIMYRRIAWLHVMSEVECSETPPCDLTHGREQMLELISNSNQWAYDLGWMCPESCHCHCIDYELCLAHEDRTDTWSVNEFKNILRSGPFALKQSDELVFGSRQNTAVVLRVRMQHEGRLPEARFRVMDGSAEIRCAGGSHTVATLRSIGGRAAASGAWSCGSVFATSPDPMQLILRVSNIHVVYDPAVGHHLADMALSFAVFGALCARLPPQTAKPPALRPPGTRAPTLAGGKIEAGQLELAETNKHAIFMIEVDRVRLDFPTAERSADALTLLLDRIQMHVGIPDLDDDQDWCNEKHAEFGQWPRKQLYSRLHFCLGSFRVDATQSKSRTSIIQPGTLDIVVDSCLLPFQCKLPNQIVTIDIDSLELSLCPDTVVCAVQAIHHVTTSQRQIAAAVDAAKKSQKQAHWNGFVSHSSAPSSPANKSEAASTPQTADLTRIFSEDSKNPSTNRLQYDSDEDVSTPHSGHEKVQHATCFVLVEVSNCSTYTLELKDYVCSAGQVTHDVPEQIDHQQKRHWTCAQRGKLKGNIGCAVFTIDSDQDNLHIELLLIWSVPFVGEDTACVSIGHAGDFTYMHGASFNRAKQQRELRKLIKKHAGPVHAVGSVRRASLGDLQVISSFGRAPLKFWVLHRQHLESISRVLSGTPDYDKLNKRRRKLFCALANHTQHFVEVIKCVYGKMEGEFICGIDPVIPPGCEVHWSSSRTRLMRGNCGCVIFSVGGLAELLIQWYAPNVGARVVDSILSHNGAFSKISERRLQQQVEEGPEVKTTFADFNVYNGLKVTHELQNGRYAQFTLVSTSEVANVARFDSQNGSLDLQHEPEYEPNAEPHLVDSQNVVVYDYLRLLLQFSLPKITTTVIEQRKPNSRALRKAPRRVQLAIDAVYFDVVQSELTTNVDASIRSVHVRDTLYSESDMCLVSSRAFGSTSDFFHVKCDINTKNNPTTKVRATSSPVTISYTNSTLYFVTELSRSVKSAQSAHAASSQTSNSDSATTAEIYSPPEDDTTADLAPVVDLELRTEPITITLCNSKLNPLVQLMVNSIDLTYISCLDKAHAATMIDLAIYYHNMELSAWEPCVEWSTFKLDQQINGRRSMTSVVSDDTINVNVTTELLVDLTSLQLDAKIEFDDDPNNDVTDDCMLYVHNKCGVPISFNLLNAGLHNHPRATQTNTNSVHPSDPDHEGWVRVWDANADNDVAVAVPRENMQLSTNPQSFDPSALGRRGELSTNYVLIRVDRIHHAMDSDSQRSTEWRPLRPQALSTCGSFIHHLETTESISTGQENAGTTKSVIRLVVDRDNGAHKVTAESPIQITNDLPVDLRMQLTDAADFRKEEISLPRLCVSVPVPLHLVDRKVRFRANIDDMSEVPQIHRDADTVGNELSAFNQDGWMWTGYICPGDTTVDSIVLMSPTECLAYCLYTDVTRGPGFSHIVLHCPLTFENLLPCAMWITLSQQEKKKRTKNQNVVFERFRLEKGARYTPPHVDVRFGMAILIELEDSLDTKGCRVDQLVHKQQAVVWPKKKADSRLTLLDAKKRELHLTLDYEHQPGKPTLVSMYVSHWIINETDLNLEYFDCSSSSAAKPANWENRPLCKPFMYSVKKGRAGKFGVGVTGGKLGRKAVSLNHPELCTTVEVKTTKDDSSQPRSRHRLLCHVTNGQGRFSRTKMVHLRHLLHFENRTPYMIAVKTTAGGLPAVVIPARRGTMPCSWPEDDALPKRLQLFCDCANLFPAGIATPSELESTLHQSDWTSEFEVCEQDGAVRVTEFWLKVAKEQNGRKYRVLRVEGTIDPETSRGVVVLREEDEHPYMIENHLYCKIGYRQVDSYTGSDRDGWQELKPRHFNPFLWDSPLLTQQLEVIINEERMLFNIDEVGFTKDDGSVCGEVVLRGHTRTLILKSSAESGFNHAHAQRQSSFPDIPDNNAFEARLHSVGFSVVNNAGSIPTELLYVFFDGIHYHAGESSTTSVKELKIADFQIADQTSDNESDSVMFGRAHSHLSNDSDDAADAMLAAETINGTRDHFHLSVIRDLKNSSEMCDAYSFIAVAIRPCDITIQEDFVLRLYGHYNVMNTKLVDACGENWVAIWMAESDVQDSIVQSNGTTVDANPALQAQGVHKVYCGDLQIHPIMFTVTVRLNGVEVNEIGLPQWVQSLGVVFGNIYRAPLSFKPVRTLHHFERSDSFLDTVTYNYWTQILIGSYRVLGAADFLGNPTQLFGNVVDGLGDFFYLPARGLITSPTDFIDGFTKGTESLVEHSLKGVLESLSSITDATSKGIDRLGTDASHASRIKALRSQHSKGVSAGLENGVEALARGLLSGVEGLALQPVAGLKEHGLPGLLLGIERGLVGAVAKPASGAMLMVSEVTGGAARSRIVGFKAGDELHRARIPRSFSHGRLIAPYSHTWAAECAHITYAQPTAVLCITVHRLIFPELVMGAALWPGPLCASISIGDGSTAYTTSTAKEGTPNAYADETTGVASWQSTGSKAGHTFAPISVELEDYALPPHFEVLTITISSTPQTRSQHSRTKREPQVLSSSDGRNDLDLPIAQFDILLSGLGLEDQWCLEAQRQRAQAIRIHNIDRSSRHEKDRESTEEGEGEYDNVFDVDVHAAWHAGDNDGPDEQQMPHDSVLHGTRTTVSSNDAVTTMADGTVRLQKHATWERVGLHTTRVPAYQRDQESVDPLPSHTFPHEDVKSYVTRPKVGSGCFIDIGLSLENPDDLPLGRGPSRSPPRRHDARDHAAPPQAARGTPSTPKKTKVDKALGFFFEFEEPIAL